MRTQDVSNTYRQFSDAELLEVYRNLEDYTIEAKNALNSEIRTRGGLDSLLANEKAQIEVFTETERIRREVRRFQGPEVDLAFLKKMIKSDLFDASQTYAIIEEAFDVIGQELEDQKIKPRTLIGGAIATAIASLIGGILWGLQMIWSGRVFVIFFFGLLLLCYGLIRLITKQSYKNTGVFVFTLIAVGMALVVWQLLYDFFGRQ